MKAVEDRFWAKVDLRGPDECWLWTRGLSSNGYGLFWDGEAWVRAHRWSYEQARGPIPAGLQIDHLCRTRGCVNPAHLEAVTQHENLLRGAGTVAQNARKTHCQRGHLFDAANTQWSGRHRRCRACERERDRRRRWSLQTSGKEG